MENTMTDLVKRVQEHDAMIKSMTMEEQCDYWKQQLLDAQGEKLRIELDHIKEVNVLQKECKALKRENGKLKTVFRHINKEISPFLEPAI